MPSHGIEPYSPGYADGALWNYSFREVIARCPMGQAGDRLWVRETWTAAMHDPKGPADCLYRADDNRGVEDLAEAKWTPSIHMPRWACRLVLPLVSVRVERLRDITEAGAKAEGVEPIGGSYREGFRAVWESIYGSWDLNPWIWVAEWDHIEVASAEAHK
mgnify:CR=1 FL=1